ncbi:MAG TPA: hypothetical protein VKV95_09000 [Terriglobia bacterium]|nr:hypothetical protein [Terriglobia bacterium]
MFIVYEYAGCVVLAMIVAALAVLACVILPLLNTGRGIMGRTMRRLAQVASWLPGAEFEARVRKE